MGNGNCGQLVLRTVMVQYEIFGVPDPYEVQEMDTKPQILGTLTFDESETLDKLMGTELNTMSKTQPSASAGSPEEIPRVKWELGETSYSKRMELPPPKIEPLLSIYKLTTEDVQKVKDKLESRSQQSMRTPQCRIKKSSTRKGMHTIKWSTLAKTGVFQVKTFSVTKRKCKYYYKCGYSGCTSTFNKMTAWNIHHLVKHKMEKFTCDKCKKTFAMPGSYRNHINFQREAKYTCPRCD